MRENLECVQPVPAGKCRSQPGAGGLGRDGIRSEVSWRDCLYSGAKPETGFERNRGKLLFIEKR
jgi:hypothetical protein